MKAHLRSTVSAGLVFGALAAMQPSALAQSLGPAPAWAQAIQPGTWATVSKNTVSDVDPANDPAANARHPDSPPWRGMSGQAGVISAWNGGAFATGFGSKGSLVLWGGGHQDYYGNELYAFDMASQMWTRLSDPYANISFPVSSGVWPNNTPSVPHTYGFAGYHPGTNSFVSLITQSNNTPSHATVPVLFDLNSRQWRIGPSNPSGRLVYGGWAVYDERRDSWWGEGGDSGGNFVNYRMNGNGANGTWTNYSAKFGALYSRAAIDPVNDILVITLFHHDDSIRAVDLKNPSGNTVTLRQGGSIPTRDGSHGWEWSPTRQAFIYWRRGASVHEVKLGGSDWRSGTWTWSNLTSSQNAVMPQDQSTGVFNRFKIVSYDDMELAVVVNSVTGPVYAYRLPHGVTVSRPNPPILNEVR